MGQIPDLFQSLQDGYIDISDSVEEIFKSQAISDMLRRAFSKIDGTVGIVSALQESIDGEVQIIITWRDNVQIVANDAFLGYLEGGSEEYQDLFDEIKEMIGDGDVEEI